MKCGVYPVHASYNQDEAYPIILSGQTPKGSNIGVSVPREDMSGWRGPEGHKCPKGL